MTYIFKLILIFSFILNYSSAVTKISINKGVLKPIPIAIYDFECDGRLNYCSDIQTVINHDLANSGLFHIINKNAFLENISDIDHQKPDFSAWRQVNATGLLTASVKLDQESVIINYHIWDIFAGKQLRGGKLSTTAGNWRRLAHMVADHIYTSFTGDKGYFDSRVVYVDETLKGVKKTKRLAIMDYDGANNKFLTSGRHLVITPRFSPDSKKILYMSYANKIPKVFLFDMENGIEKLIGDFPGMSFAPRFSPDGKSVLMSIANDGMSHIYQLNLVTGAKKRLTKGRSINTSPCYTPEQKQIIFNSDRSGRPHLYIMDSDGSNVKRISSNIGRYATPVVSPRGDLIAYTKWADGSGLFSIGVMNLDGSGERIVARGYLVEGPTWSPNGRVIMYSKQLKGFKNNPGKVNLYSVDITGYNEKIIKTKNQASDPSWSSILD